MKDNTKSRWSLAALCACTLAVIAACGGSSAPVTPATNPVPPQPTAQAYNGPGSKWDVDLVSDGSFQITRRADVNSAVDLTIDGTWTRTAAGFVLMTVERPGRVAL